MKFRPVILLLPIFLLVLCLSNNLNAQTTASGELTGVVSDPSGAVVPDAQVEIKDDSKGVMQSTKTDHEGVYRFFFVAPGRYTLTVTLERFRKDIRVVKVLLGPPVTVNVTLELWTANTTVKVTGEAPLIQAENGDVSTTMNQKQISETPNPGNDLTYIAQTGPGMVMNVETGNYANFSSLGMPSISNLFTIDGLSQNENGFSLPFNGASGLLLGQNQIQEATVVSVGYSGQFGSAAGANVNYITKSGSNEVHGNAQYYWNGRVFNANNWFNNDFDQPRPFDIANQWAASLGGSIKKDKLFFFVDTEGLRLFLPETFYVVLPSSEFETATLANIDSRFGLASASDAFYRKIFDLYNAAPGASSATPGSFSDPLGCTGFLGPGGLGANVPCAEHYLYQRDATTADTLISGRVDWILGKDDRAFLRLQDDFGHTAIYLDPISPLFDAIYNGSYWQGEVLETHTFSSSAASQFLLGGLYNTGTNTLENPSKAMAALPTSLNFSTANTFSSMGADNGLAFPSGRPETHYQIAEDLVNIWRNHKLGIGMGFERIYWTSIGSFGNNLVGTLTPQTLDAFYQGGIDPASSGINFTQLTQSFASATSERIKFYNLAFYGQDEWHARPDLTLTLALRSEHYSNPVCKSGCFTRMNGPFDSVSHDPDQPYDQAILVHQKEAFQGTDSIVWSPRFGFAWQPLGLSHNTVIRGGVGIFHDPVPGNVAWWLFSNPPLLNSYSIVGDNLTPNEKTSLFKDAAASNAAFVTGFAAGQTLAQIQATISSFYPPGFSPPAITVPGNQTHSPQYQRWSLELQHAFGAGTSVSIGYFGNHGIRELLKDPNANAYGFGSLPAALCTSPPVPPCADPRFSGVTEANTNAVSNYNGMVISFKHQITGWGRGIFQANYTYSHAFDEISDGGLPGVPFTYGSSPYAQDPDNLRGAYGPADYDVRHSLNASYVWEVPVKAAFRGHGSDYLVKGWQVSGTIFARTGFPYTVFDYYESSLLAQNNYFGNIYAVPVGPLRSGASCGERAASPLAPNPCQPPQLLMNGNPNPNANFLQTGCETGFNTGNLPGPSGPCSGPAVTFAQGRNRFRGPSYFNTDFSIMKNSKVPGWENAVLGIGFQFFNLFNHPNFSLPDNGSSDQTFGQIQFLDQPPTGILGGGAAYRMIQLKVQLLF